MTVNTKCDWLRYLLNLFGQGQSRDTQLMSYSVHFWKQSHSFCTHLASDHSLDASDNSSISVAVGNRPTEILLLFKHMIAELSDV